MEEIWRGWRLMRRDLGQMSFADGLVNQRAGRNEWLNRIDDVVDWSAVVKILDQIYASDEGRPSYPLLTLVKLLLLQQWYGLSDPGVEEAVDDRLSFRRFAGLPLDEGVPDHSAIWRFRQELAKQDPMGGWTAAGSLTEWGCSSDQPLWRRPWKRSPTAPQN